MWQTARNPSKEVTSEVNTEKQQSNWDRFRVTDNPGVGPSDDRKAFLVTDVLVEILLSRAKSTISLLKCATASPRTSASSLSPNQA